MLLTGAKMKDISVLVVDDQSHAREHLKKILEENIGCTVVAVGSGKEALAEVKTHVPDIILLDAMMPHMDGYATCQKLRSRYATRDVPIIFVTADDRRDSIDKCLIAGASDFVTKPVMYSLLYHRMRTQITLQHLQKRVRVHETKPKDD